MRWKFTCSHGCRRGNKIYGKYSCDFYIKFSCGFSVSRREFSFSLWLKSNTGKNFHVRGRNAFSVKQFKEYLVHEMHKQIRRDFLCANPEKASDANSICAQGKSFSHLLTFIIIQNGIFYAWYSPAYSTFLVAAQLLSGHSPASFAAWFD